MTCIIQAILRDSYCIVHTWWLRTCTLCSVAMYWVTSTFKPCHANCLPVYWNAFMCMSHYLLPLPWALRELAPLQCDLSVLVKLQAASSLFTQRLRTQAHTYTDSQQQQLQRAGHEPVCLVPGSVGKYLPVPDCTLQKSLDTHSEGFLLC